MRSPIFLDMLFSKIEKCVFQNYKMRFCIYQKRALQKYKFRFAISGRHFFLDSDFRLCIAIFENYGMCIPQNTTFFSITPHAIYPKH